MQIKIGDVYVLIAMVQFCLRVSRGLIDYIFQPIQVLPGTKHSQQVMLTKAGDVLPAMMMVLLLSQEPASIIYIFQVMVVLPGQKNNHQVQQKNGMLLLRIRMVAI